MQKLIRTLVFAVLALSVAGCGLVYVPDVQQGNILDKKTVDQLKPGMTKHQVLVLMGSPSVSTPFNSSRWDYVATQQHRGGSITVRNLTLTFNNDTLVRTDGEFFPHSAEQLAKESNKYKTEDADNEAAGDKDGVKVEASGSTDNGVPPPGQP